MSMNKADLISNFLPRKVRGRSTYCEATLDTPAAGWTDKGPVVKENTYEHRTKLLHLVSIFLVTLAVTQHALQRVSDGVVHTHAPNDTLEDPVVIRSSTKV